MSSISVIIPTKNRIGYLLETLDNINAQTLKPVEIIIVDDHSTDGTEETLKEKRIENLIYIKSKKPGPGAARNEGLRIAQGEYIQFFDSDDLMTLNKLELQSLALNNANCGMAYSPYLYAVRENDEWYATEPILNYFPLPRHMLYYLVKGWNIITQACLFSRDLLSEVGKWDEEIITHEDYLYLFEVSRKISSPVHVKDCGVIYRQHGHQLTNHHSSMGLRAANIEKVLLRVLSYPELNWYQKKMIEGRLYLNSQFVEKNNGQRWDVLSRMFALLVRAENKAGRIRTGSKWQPWHGAFTSEKESKNIIQNSYL